MLSRCRRNPAVLPGDLFDRASPRDLERCRRRVSVEVPRDLRRHLDAARIT